MTCGVSEEVDINGLNNAAGVFHMNLWCKAPGVVTDVDPRTRVRLAGGGRIAEHFTFHPERL